MLLTSDRRVLSTFHMSGHAVAVCQTSYAAPVWAMEMKVEGYVTVDVGDGGTTANSIPGASGNNTGNDPTCAATSGSPASPANCRPPGGASRIAATGAFHTVRELRGGGLLLQATETLAGYDDQAMREVFHALAPVLPPGIPEDDPARENLRVVFEDASGV
jgi:hypothetical protein